MQKLLVLCRNRRIHNYHDVPALYAVVRSTRADAFANDALLSPRAFARVQSFVRGALSHSSTPWHIASLQQVHGRRIQSVIQQPGAHTHDLGDGLLARDAGIALIIKTADCVPVTLTDADSGVFGVAHAGWRGMRSGIVESLVMTARRRYGLSPTLCRIMIGPAIHQCCYAVSPQRARAFVNRFGARVVHQRNGVYYLDLVACAVTQLSGAGVARSRISIDPLCTACSGNDRYYSFRRGDTMLTNLTVVARVR